MVARLLAIILALLSCAAANGQTQESFESFQPGQYEELATVNGTWSASAGSLEINSEHAEFGQRCLRFNGEASEFEFRSHEEMASMTFVAERWTRSPPFKLSLWCKIDGEWVDISEQIGEIAVGGFQTQVHLRFPSATSHIRGVLMSKAKTGMMIDMVEVAAPGPLKWQGVRLLSDPFPMLIGRDDNPVCALECSFTGNQGDLEIEAIEFDWIGDLDPRFIVAHRWVWGQPRSDAVPELSTESNDEELADGRLLDGRNRLWLMVELAADAPLHARLGARLRSVQLSHDRTEVVAASKSPNLQRTAVAVRDAGDDDVAVYRIPGLVSTNEGSLIAVYDIRHNNWADLPGDIDVGMSRSTDGGQTWEPMQTILDFGNSPEFAGDGVGDPSVLVDRETGTIWVAATWHHGKLGWHGSGPGFEPHETGQVVLTRSDDDGLTWSAPINITRQVKLEDWAFLLPGPGRGICTEDGTLVFPAQFRNSPNEGRDPSSCVMFSEDNGKTWQLSKGARLRTTESAIVEMPNGEWMLNMRDDRRNGKRTVALTKNRGQTWRLLTDRKASPLAGPVCMASLINLGTERNGKASQQLLFSNPSVERAPRRKMTVRWSGDAGKSWRDEHAIEIDRGQSAGYSCLCLIDENTVGILYESSRAHMVFQAIPLADFKP